MNLERKQEILTTIEIAIEDLQSDLTNELTSESEAKEINLDLNSLKTILGHLLTLKTI